MMTRKTKTKKKRREGKISHHLNKKKMSDNKNDEQILIRERERENSLNEVKAEI